MRRLLIGLALAGCVMVVVLWLRRGAEPANTPDAEVPASVQTRPAPSSLARTLVPAEPSSPLAAHDAATQEAPADTLSAIQRLERGMMLAPEKPQSSPVVGNVAAALPAPELNAEEEARALRALPSNERKVVEMYDRMAEAFARDESNCQAMAASINAIIDTHAGVVRAMTSDWAREGPQAAAEAQARAEAALGPRLENIRQSMRNALARCAAEPALINALRTLAAMQQATEP